ncbi:TIGR02281 family clan AA aspartic protease [Yoonia sp. SDW83-1]|uniref:TIGR02281 family clan AA aspartic protease n=1 Tax=Yoonia sp. SDW83-1 TaxID=3366945 RepID=UPI00398C3801
MTTDQIMQAIYLGLLGLAIAGSYIAANRNDLGKMAQQALIWLLIFVGVVGAYGLWDEISNDVTGRQTFIGDARVEVPRSRDGHYYLTLDINDVPVDFVVDTGASQVVLTRRDAARIGLDPDTLNYFGSASTANGVVRTAPVQLETVAMGDILDRNLPAVVNEGEMEGSLLGMTYLGLYDRIEITNGRLVLTR